MNNKTGLLLPRSVLYPSINFDLLEGMRTGFEASEQKDNSIISDNIGIGANDQLVYNVCERMLMDGVTAIAGYINPATALKLQPLFETANAVLICIDSGYQFMHPEQHILPNVVYVSLQGTLCCRATATMALTSGFTSFAFTSSFLDAGYRPFYTYMRAVTGGGADIVFNHVTTLKKNDFTIEPLAKFISSEPQHAVIAAYCGDMLSDFCEHMGKSETLSGNLFGSPFMLEETWLEKSDYPGADLKGVVSWAKGLDNPVNISFKKSLEEKGRTPNIFSVLGYETAQVISAIFNSGKRGAAAVTALKGWQYESPRGTVKIDAETNQSIPPLYGASGVLNIATGKCVLQVDYTLGHVQEQWELLQDDIQSLAGNTTNWLNTYPCIES